MILNKVAFALIPLILVATACSNQSQTTKPPGTISRNSGARTTEVPTSPPTSLQSHQLTNWTGNGPAESKDINVTTAPWSVNWSFQCGRSVGMEPFSFIVKRNGIVDTQDAGASTIGVSDAGILTYTDQGKFNIVVNSNCNWNILVSEK